MMIPKIAEDPSVKSRDGMSSGEFSAAAGSMAVFGVALGKASCGLLADSLGARRILSLSSASWLYLWCHLARQRH